MDSQINNQGAKVLAKKLRIGDTIAIVAPSKPIESVAKDEQFRSGLKFIERMGFKTALGNAIGSQVPTEKAADINLMLADSRINAILFAKGGDAAQEVLPFIEWETVKGNPKIVCGYSDATVLLTAINSKTGIVTFHGNDANSFGRQQTNYDRDEFLKTFVEGNKREIPSNSARLTVRDGKASGTLIGGNLRCLLKLKDTEFWPDFSGSILFLESYKPNDTMPQLFEELRGKGVFEKISGLIVGHNYGLQVLAPEQRQMEQIILDMGSGYNFPILKTDDFGHMCSQTVMPIGAHVELDAGEKRITILDDFLRSAD